MSVYKRYGLCYLMGALGALWLKAYYSGARSEELLWILAPTIGWVRMLSGMIFEYLPGTGYVSHLHHLVIAPSCSGVQFLLIVFLTLVFSFSHRMGTARKGMIWTFYAAVLAYLYTILVNGIRITLSVYVPEWLQKINIFIEGSIQEPFHTILGIMVYFVFLLSGYWLADRATEKISKLLFVEQKRTKTHYGFLSPVFWYLFMVLGVPFLNGAYVKNHNGFIKYAYLVLGVCALILGIWWLLRYSFGVSFVNSRNLRIK